MSEDLFIDAKEALQRLESILDLALIKYNLVTCKDKTSKLIVYHAAMTFTRRDGSNGYISVSGESFPDLYLKIADSPELVKP